MNGTRFELAQADLVAAQRAWWSGAARLQTFITMCLAFWAAYAIIFLAVSVRSRAAFVAALPSALGTAAAIAIAVTVSLFAIGYLLTPRRARKAFRQHKALAGEFTVMWDERGVKIEHPRGSTNLPWSVLHAWLEGPATILLFQNANLFNAIPKRALTRDQQADLIRHLRDAGVTERTSFGLPARRTRG